MVPTLAPLHMLQADTTIGMQSTIGNFVETKRTIIGNPLTGKTFNVI